MCHRLQNEISLVIRVLRSPGRPNGCNDRRKIRNDQRSVLPEANQVLCRRQAPAIGTNDMSEVNCQVLAICLVGLTESREMT